MAKYAYPAIFTPEENGTYSIVFPDLEGCYTCGDNLEDGIEMAEDVLALVLYGYEKDGKPIPLPSNRDDLKTAITNLLSDKDSVQLEYVDMEDIEQVIDSVIEANTNLKESISSGNLEMIGKDLSTLEKLLEQLEVLRDNEKDGGKRNELTK